MQMIEVLEEGSVGEEIASDAEAILLLSTWFLELEVLPIRLRMRTHLSETNLSLSPVHTYIASLQNTCPLAR
jgi:hypothetical protein